jgi:Tol biopolymer transport system component
MPTSTQRTSEDRKMIMKRILKTLAVMAVLVSLAAVPALAQTPTGRLVLVGERETPGTLELQTARFGQSNNFTRPLPGSPFGREPDVTPDGETVVYALSGSPGAIYSVPMNKSVAPTRLTTTDQSYPYSTLESPTVSPDGNTVYFQYTARDDNENTLINDIYSVPIEGGDITRVTHDNREHSGLEITPDGEHFVYSSSVPDEGQSIYVQPVIGGPATTLSHCGSELCRPEVSPDGSKVAFVDCCNDGLGVFTVPFSTTEEATPTKVPGAEIDGHTFNYGFYPMVAFSPDGRYIAYNTVEQCSHIFCDFDADGVTPETRLIPVEGGNYNSIGWGDFNAQTQVAWAPPSSDTTAPQLGPLPDITEEATKPTGAAVTFSATATDAVDPNPRVRCERRIPPSTQFSGVSSGATFPIATIMVRCTAEDAVGNRSTTDSFDVTVRDTTPPAITGMPSDIVAEATGADGAQVFWSQPTATDLVNGSRTVTCTPASGTTFALGETTVSCTATDARSNTATKTFKVTVQDTTAPTVDAVNPVDGTQGVARGIKEVTANFSEAVQAATLTSNTVQLFSGNSTRPIKATLSRNPSTDPTSVTLTPSSKLDAKTRYTAKIKGGQSGVKDLAGNPLASDFSWSFTTGSR